MGIENLRMVSYNKVSSVNRFKLSRCVGESPEGDYIWQGHAGSYSSIKALYNVVSQNPKGLKFIYDEEIEKLLEDEKNLRKENKWKQQ